MNKKMISVGLIVNLLTIAAMVLIKNPFIAVAIAMPISIGIAYLIGRRDELRLGYINEKLKELASGKGDLTIKLPVDGSDSLGQMSESFNAVMEEVEQIIAKVNITSTLVAESSINLSENLISILDNERDDNHMQSLKDKMEVIAENVNSQTAYSEEAAASTTEISQSVNIIAERAENTKNIAVETNQLAKDSESSILKNIEELRKIEASVEGIEKKVFNLENSSKKIYSIVEMINKITEQTNLLSLNAAIEAARAGEAGRGFSIVADEVRKLANNSSEATSEIEDLVKVIQDEIKELVELTKESFEMVQTGRRTTEGTNTKILSIIEKINVTSSEVEEISISIREQKQAVEEINIAMDEISNKSVEISELSTDQLDANNNISNTLREATGYSAKLSEIADALKNIAINYKISDDVEIKRNKAVEWSNDFSVKISHIDDEHKRLFDLINDLNDAMLDGSSTGKIGEILTSLVDYTAYHFDHEEEMMQNINYPGYSKHITYHKAFVDKMLEFKAGFESGEMLLSVKIIDFLKDWLVSHIMNIDQKYTEHAHKNGVR